MYTQYCKSTKFGVLLNLADLASFFWYDTDSGHKGPFRVAPPRLHRQVEAPVWFSQTLPLNISKSPAPGYYSETCVSTGHQLLSKWRLVMDFKIRQIYHQRFKFASKRCPVLCLPMSSGRALEVKHL